MLATLTLALLIAPGRPSESGIPDVTAETFAKATPEHRVAMMDALEGVHPREIRVHQARDRANMGGD